MASSLIRINEATSTELQQLKGIGPQRAKHIEHFRKSVSPIRNVMDLCSATGLGLKAAESLAEKIAWDSDDPSKVNTGPVILTTLVAIGLIYTGFDEITKAPFVAPASIYNFSLALILLGGLTAAGDIMMAAVRKTPSESTWIFPLSIVMLVTGFIGIVVMAISAQVLTFPAQFTATLTASIRLVFFGLVMVWLFYGPAIFLRHYLNDIKRLNQIGRFYDFSLSAILVGCIGLLVFGNTSSLWIEEIFSLWCLVIALIGGSELVRGHSAFTQMLSQQDQSRYHFAVTRTRGAQKDSGWKTTDHRMSLIAAYCVFSGGGVVIVLLLITLFHH